MYAKRFSRLSLSEREVIENHLKNGLNMDEVARMLGRAKSSIQNEVSRNGGRYNYNASSAHMRSEEIRRHKNESLCKKLNEDQIKTIQDGISRELSIKQICDESGIERNRLFRFLNRNSPREPQKDRTEEKTNLEERVSCLEMQVEIIIEQLRNLNG